MSTEEDVCENILPDPGLWAIQWKPITSLSESQMKVLVFWPVAFKDHCLFMYSGLFSAYSMLKKDPSGKVWTDRPGLLWSPLWEFPSQEIHHFQHYASKLAHLKQTSLTLAHQWRRIEAYIVELLNRRVSLLKVLSKIIPIWNETYLLTHTLLKLLDEKVWIGNLDQALLQGMLLEMYYFRARLQNTITPDQEVAFFVDDAALHLALAAHFQNPGIWSRKQRQFIYRLLQLSEEGFQIRDSIRHEAQRQCDQLSSLSFHVPLEFVQEAKSFFTWFKDAKPASLLHPLAARHAIMEAMFEIDRLEELQDQQQKQDVSLPDF